MPNTVLGNRALWADAYGNEYSIPDEFNVFDADFTELIENFTGYDNDTGRAAEQAYRYLARNGDLQRFMTGMAPEDPETQCHCESCKARRRDPSAKVKNAVLHSYSYKPRNWLEKKVPGDKFPYYMGVELETSINRMTPGFLNNRMACDLRRPKQFWVSKRDGSVSGPEFASHPATLTYWHDAQSDLSEMFKLLIHAGYRSHNGGQAGMHVNISKSAFRDSEHLFKFLYLITNWRELSTMIAQRSEEQVGSWARFIPYSRQMADAMLNQSWTRTTDKYSVVNAPRAQGRLEFRLPRGTLRIDRFYKNLEWTAAMIGYTRSIDGDNPPSAHDFLSWVKGFPNVYENFISFITEKNTAIQTVLNI